MTARITDVDHGYAALVQRVFRGRNPVLEVGVLEGDASKGYPGGVTVGDVAQWQEFGTATIPERSFIRAWFDQAEPELRRDLAKLMQGVIKGTRTADQALELLGLRAVGAIQSRIADGVPPPNAPSTVAKKGSSTPLIDSGTLRSSISYRVTDEG